MLELSARTRREALRRMAAHGVDVLVIGGGITGAGVALDAAARGFRVGLVDARDFAGGTTSRSTKLVHGGIRYVPQGNIALVREALHERATLLTIAPHLVRPLPFLIPFYREVRRPLGMRVPAILSSLAPLGVRAGLWAYDFLAGASASFHKEFSGVGTAHAGSARQPVPRHRRLSQETAVRLAPGLRTDGLRAVFLYYDAQTDDVRLTLAVLRSAAVRGALLANHARVTALRLKDGRVTGAEVRDEIAGAHHTIGAPHVVNAAGIWAEEVARLDGTRPAFRLKHAKGVHLVVDRARAGLHETAVVIPETSDGRLAFLVPWGRRVILGTTDEAYSGDLVHPVAEPGEVRYLIEHANHVLNTGLTTADVIGAYAGLRPLISAAEGAPTAALSREHQVVESATGLVSIVGGKLTTYRRMAQDAVDHLARRAGRPLPCTTAILPLDGAEGLEEVRPRVPRRVQALGLGGEVSKHLLEGYGDHAEAVLDLAEENPALATPLLPSLPFIAAEVVYAARHEMALTLTDLLLLRMRLTILDPDHGLGCARRAAEILGAEMGWGTGEMDAQVEAYRQAVRRELEAILPAGAPA